VDEEALARHEQAAANAREAARLQELIRQEKTQELRLVAIRQRQAVQQAATEAQARAAARQLAQSQARETAKAEAREAAKAEARTQAAVPAAPEASVARARVAEPKASDTRETVAAVAADETPALKSTEGVYIVRKGDYLTKLARERGLSVAQLAAWNKLKSETVVPGQRLVLQTAANEETEIQATHKKPHRETAATHPTAAKMALATASPGRHAELNPAAPQVHRVQLGDTLFNISQRFNVSVQVLRELNHLKSDEVKLGQKLLVPQG